MEQACEVCECMTAEDDSPALVCNAVRARVVREVQRGLAQQQELR